MQMVRDQADWLLNNIIPAHAVESLKTNTKYSENHKLTAVMFASITNWHEMYEENFEGLASSKKGIRRKKSLKTLFLSKFQI